MNPDPVGAPRESVWQRHAVQRELARLAGPLWVPLAAFWMRVVLRYRIEGVRELRERYRVIRETSRQPLLICANHLTLIDSFVVGWALGSPFTYLRRFSWLPWNVPEATNFAADRWSSVLAYLGKCVPILRGGPREGVARVLNRVAHLLRSGEVALVFPEGGRSRSSRVEGGNAAWGVGRIIADVPGCRVLCIYLRGDGQKEWSAWPVRGEKFRVSLETIEPKSDARGARRSRDLGQQVVDQLVRMENDYFAERGMTAVEG